MDYVVSNCGLEIEKSQLEKEGTDASGGGP